jgi:molecular chaperone DnaK (HSP70)
MLSRSVLLVAVLFGMAQASVMGIDVGSQYLKVAALKYNSSVEIMLNDQSHRKTDHFVGFRGTSRYLGHDAKSFAGRFPVSMLTMVNRVAGLPFDHADIAWLNSVGHLPFKYAKNARGAVDVVAVTDSHRYSAEELLAMLLQDMKRITEVDVGEAVSSAVITIPEFFTQRQRLAVVRAAELVGIETLGLMHATTAAVMQYAVTRRGFGNDTVHVAVVDVGASFTEVGVYSIAPTPVPNGTRVRVAEALGQITTLAVASDRYAGGRELDACIAAFIEDQFVTATKKPRVLGGAAPKAIFALMRGAETARETLSVNTVADVVIEGMAPDYDFRARVTRDEFEERCAPIANRIVALVSDALDSAGVAAADLHAIEMMGGASRTPMITTKLSDIVGRTVDRTLNTDDSGALGAGMLAARLSGRFRVKGFALVDVVRTEASVAITARDDDTPPPTPRPLLASPVVGSARSISLNRTDDFNVTITFPGEPGATLIAVTQVQAAVGNVTSVNISRVPHHHSARLVAEVDQRGLVVGGEALVKVTYFVNATLRKKKGKKKAKKAVLEDEEGATAAEAPAAEALAADVPAADAATPTRVLRQRNNMTAVVVATTYTGAPLPLDDAGAAASVAILDAMDAAEEALLEASTAKNALETYVQWIKFDAAEAVQAALTAALAELEEWLDYGDGSADACPAAEYTAWHEKLNSSVTAVQEQVQEQQKDL